MKQSLIETTKIYFTNSIKWVLITITFVRYQFINTKAQISDNDDQFFINRHAIYEAQYILKYLGSNYSHKYAYLVWGCGHHLIHNTDI
jgi:hypothetical protein